MPNCTFVSILLLNKSAELHIFELPFPPENLTYHSPKGFIKILKGICSQNLIFGYCVKCPGLSNKLTLCILQINANFLSNHVLLIEVNLFGNFELFQEMIINNDKKKKDKNIIFCRCLFTAFYVNFVDQLFYVKFFEDYVS